MSRSAWAWGLATVTSTGSVLDAWYPAPQLGGVPTASAPEELAALAGADPVRRVERALVCTTVDLDAPPADAAAQLETELAAAASAPVTLAAGDARVTKTPAELGLAVDYAASVERAGGTITLNPLEMIDRLGGGNAYAPVVTVDRARLDAAPRSTRRRPRRPG